MGRGTAVAEGGRYARLKEILVPAMLLLITLFAFGPFTIYYGNPGELNVGYLSILRVYFIPAAAMSLFLIILALFLPSRVFRFYNPFLLSLGILLWIQGSVIVGSYGFLDGTAIEFSAQAWRVWHETVLWLGIPALIIFFYRNHKQNMLFLGKLVLVIEVVLLAAGILTSPASFRGGQPGAPPDDIYELSSRKNILHILLDGFQSDCFSEVLERSPEFADAFDGFVFFENNMGVFPTTRMSIPAILTGQVYENRRPMEEFTADAMGSETLPRTLFRNGYRVDMLTLRKYRFGGEFSNWYTIPMPFGEPAAQRQFAAAQAFDLSLFRHVPHLLKPWVFRNQKWLSVSLVPFDFPEDRTAEPSNAVAFFRDYTERVRVVDELPRYKFIHLFMPHLPMVLDCDCKFLGPVRASREAFVDQSACTIRVLVDFLNVLRREGAYEDSLIIVSADHGNKFPSEILSSRFEQPLVPARAAALLLVKASNSSGKLKVSRAPVLLSDIPATVADLEGFPGVFPGRSVMRVREDEKRERTFRYYLWRHRYWNYDFIPGMKEYLVTGDVFDAGSWQFRSLVQPSDSVLYPPNG